MGKDGMGGGYGGPGYGTKVYLETPKGAPTGSGGSYSPGTGSHALSGSHGPNEKILNNSPILIKRWDTDHNEEYYESIYLEDLIKNPNGVNLELLGLHFLNAFRLDRGLDPLKHQLSTDKK